MRTGTAATIELLQKTAAKLGLHIVEIQAVGG